MNRIEKIASIRQSLKLGKPSIGSWMQIPDSSIAEILGRAGYDWVAVDMEHGTVSPHQLPDIFRSLELGGTLPMVRLAQGSEKDCKQALDAGAGGVIVPMVETAEQLTKIRDYCRWPPSGLRGVGFSRANLFGASFGSYSEEAQAPLLVAMIENIRAVNNLKEILTVAGLDAAFIGPYDLSASMGLTGKFDEQEFLTAMENIRRTCKLFSIPCGVHVVQPDPIQLSEKIDEGFSFIAYSIDAVFLRTSAINPHQPSR